MRPSSMPRMPSNMTLPSVSTAQSTATTSRSGSYSSRSTSKERAAERLDPLTLNFADPLLERVFRRFLARRKLALTQRVSLLACVLSLLLAIQTPRKSVETGDTLKWSVEWKFRTYYFPTIGLVLVSWAGKWGERGSCAEQRYG